ncbi:MAG: C40 family peptidase [Anaerolineales bacterium]|nr:C40 family peptidase [Anaerolineales bacterium]
MKKFRIAVVLFFILLTGCAEGGEITPPTVRPAETVQPAEATSPVTPASAVTTAPTVLPTQTPTLPPTIGPQKFSVRATKADVWNAPENEDDYWSLQTQLILGEKVLVIATLGEWSQIVAVEQPSHKDPRGYPGWVRSEFLAQGWPEAEYFAVVMKARTRLRAEQGGAPGMLIYLDTRLPVVTTREQWAQVRLPDGAEGWLPFEDVRLTQDLSEPYPAYDLFALAESLVGAPYKWGGTISDALDCASLPYRLFHAYGILMSRDADDQALEGEFVGRNDVRKGDLIFVSELSGGEITHEVMYWGNNMVMDADITNGVMIRPMSEFFVYYYWITARRFLPQ